MTWFDYSEYGGMGGAVEMCSGVGACRKKLSGTMCPSYMATHEEAHSTRGRANALRLAMTGHLGESGLGDKGVYEVLDLCLECRACKAECPVGVRYGTFQEAEFPALDYWSRHGTPHAARALWQRSSNVGFGEAGSLPRFELAFGERAFVRWMNEKLFDIDKRRTLHPAWKRETFAKWLARNGPRPQTGKLISRYIQRHVYQPLRSGDRYCLLLSNAGTRRLYRWRGEAGLLRTSVDFGKACWQRLAPMRKQS